MNICAKHPELNGAQHREGGCPKCVKAAQVAAWKAANKARISAQGKEYRAENSAKVAASKAATHAKNREANKAKMRERYAANRGAAAVQNRATYLANRPRILQKVKEYREANADTIRVRSKVYHAEWARNNRAIMNARWQKYRAAKLQATPAWANAFFIEEAYYLAQLRERVCGGVWHVDHIVPLQSARVCGLHCEANLQVIRSQANTAKGNRHWPDMP